MLKKYISKLFNKKKYLNIKSQEKIQETVVTFKKHYEEKYKYTKSYKGKDIFKFFAFRQFRRSNIFFSIIKELSKTHQCNFYIQVNKKIPVEYLSTQPVDTT